MIHLHPKNYPEVEAETKYPNFDEADFKKANLPYTDAEISDFIADLEEKISSVEDVDGTRRDLTATLCRVYNLFVNDEYVKGRKIMHYQDLQKEV